MRLAIISDTHLPKGTRVLPDACVARLEEADAIVHAGDFITRDVLRSLERIGPPVYAVRGNVDTAELREQLPETLELEFEGVRVAIVHNGGPADGRLARLRRRFPEAAAAIFGHSHQPLHERGDDGFQIFNPGSPTERRRAPAHTMGLAEVDGSAIEFELVTLD